MQWLQRLLTSTVTHRKHKLSNIDCAMSIVTSPLNEKQHQENPNEMSWQVYMNLVVYLDWFFIVAQPAQPQNSVNINIHIQRADSAAIRQGRLRIQ